MMTKIKLLALLVSHIAVNTYWVFQNLPQICTASAKANIKNALKHMQYSLREHLVHASSVPEEGQLELLPPIRQDGDKSRKLHAVPNKQTKPGFLWRCKVDVL